MGATSGVVILMKYKISYTPLRPHYTFFSLTNFFYVSLNLYIKNVSKYQYYEHKKKSKY